MDALVVTVRLIPESLVRLGSDEFVVDVIFTAITVKHPDVVGSTVKLAPAEG